MKAMETLLNSQDLDRRLTWAPITLEQFLAIWKVENVSKHSNFGSNQTTITEILSEDLHAFLLPYAA
jgi:hypothetical protein